MQRILPPALREGARVAIVSPASAPQPDAVARGVERLRQMGYEPVLGAHALDRGPLYYAGDFAARAADLHAALADETIDGILCTRGGWGSAELLPHLDAAFFRAHPKPFLGYSDHTSLHTWIQRETGLVTFYAPMVAADFARKDRLEDAVEVASWKHALHGSSPWSLTGNDGLRTLRAGKAEGTLVGGCLSILTESLGTPYAFLPPEQNAILFLEDVGTRPYQWDRMLVHLRYAGILKNVRGIVFGDMEQCVDAAESDLLERAILHALRDFDGPIAIGLRSGHVHGANITLPLGIHTRLESSTEASRLDILESAVS
jgi:muramoyltetrapeptide carboxypeptidase